MSRTDDEVVADYPGLLRLDGRSMIVLGAGQGIGRQSAHALASVGAEVVCVDRDADLAKDVASEVDGVALSADITKRADVERIIAESIDATGRLDGLVDIVGIAEWSPLLDIDDEIYESQLDICFRHAFLAMQACGRAMVDRGTPGTMAFVASVSGTFGAPNHAIYGAAKAAMIALVKSGAVELGPHGVRVNAVAPGNTATPRMRSRSTPDSAAAQARTVPLGRVGRTVDIASALLFLVSDLASQITGQTLVVDGGVNAKFPYLPTDNG